MIISKIRKLLGIESDDERLQRLIKVNESISDLSKSIDEVAEEFTVKNENFKQLLHSSTINDEIKKSVKVRYDNFLEHQKEDLQNLVRERNSLREQHKELIKDEKLFKAISDLSFYDGIKKKFKEGEVSLSTFDLLITAKQGKVKYADNIVLNEKGQLLILQRARVEDDKNGGKWCLPGGHVDAGEEFEEAAIRELKEESGICVDEVEEIGVYADDKAEIHYFKSSITEFEAITLLQNGETESSKWIDLKDIDLYSMPFNMAENIKALICEKDTPVTLPEKQSILGEIGDTAIEKIKQILSRKVGTIEKAINTGSISKELGEELIEKARSGKYADTPENKRLKRVGQSYGSKKGEDTKEEKEGKKEPETDKKQGEEKPYLQEHIERLKKDGFNQVKTDEKGNVFLYNKEKNEKFPVTKGDYKKYKDKIDEILNKKESSIEEHARSASESALQNAAKGGDEEHRKAAKAELDRREKEESPKDENKEEGKEISPIDELNEKIEGELNNQDNPLNKINEKIEKEVNSKEEKAPKDHVTYKTPIGQKITRSDGKKFEKVAHTGDISKDWKEIKEETKKEEPKKEEKKEGKAKSYQTFTGNVQETVDFYKKDVEKTGEEMLKLVSGKSTTISDSAINTLSILGAVTTPLDMINLFRDKEFQKKILGDLTEATFQEKEEGKSKVDVSDFSKQDKESPYMSADITTPETKGHVSIKEMGDKTATIADIQIGYEGKEGRGKGYGTDAYIEIGKKLDEKGVTLESTNWEKHGTAISPQALKVWEKLEKQGYAKKIGEKVGKVLNRESGEEESKKVPLYSFVNKGNDIEKSEQEDIFEKARSGTYSDTPENKKLGRVGQKYGSKKGEEEKSSESETIDSLKEEYKTALEGNDFDKLAEIHKKLVDRSREANKQATSGKKPEEETKDSSQSEKEYNENKKKVKLDKSEKKVLSDYLDDSSKINESLRNKKGGYVENEVKQIDEIFKKEEVGLPEDMQLKRVVMISDYNKDLLDLKEGDNYSDEGYVSTTVSGKTQRFIETAYRQTGKTVTLKINAKKGTPAIPVDASVDDKNAQFEYLLQRGTKFKVKSVKEGEIELDIVDEKGKYGENNKEKIKEEVYKKYGKSMNLDELNAVIKTKEDGQTKSKEFKEWFGESKIKDDEGEPLILFHGTNSDFNEFDTKSINKKHGVGVYGQGFYFSDDSSTAGYYGKKRKLVYLKMQNPFDIEKDFEKNFGELPKGKYPTDVIPDLHKKLKKMGYDGVIGNNSVFTERGKEYIVFEPNQIKSATENEGNFDPNSNDITKSNEPQSWERWL